MAGVEGRLKAAKKLTSTPLPSMTRGATVENHKAVAQVAERISVTSQIELAGFLEQLNKIDEFLNTYHQYSKLRARKDLASSTLDKANIGKAQVERDIETIGKILEEELVPFELIEPVQIRPIEWTKPSAPEPGRRKRGGRTP